MGRSGCKNKEEARSPAIDGVSMRVSKRAWSREDSLLGELLPGVLDEAGVELLHHLDRFMLGRKAGLQAHGGLDPILVAQVIVAENGSEITLLLDAQHPAARRQGGGGTSKSHPVARVIAKVSVYFVGIAASELRFTFKNDFHGQPLVARMEMNREYEPCMECGAE
jgi:hypothetical protein